MPVVLIRGISTVFLKGKAPSTRFLDKTIWNPRTVIDLLSRAVFESGNPFLLVLGPTFSDNLTNSDSFMEAVGTDKPIIYFLHHSRLHGGN